MLTTLAVHGTEPSERFVVVARVGDPTRSARGAALIGATNCSWTTGVMAQRVLTEGVPWTFVGRLAPTQNQLRSRVAAPYTVGPRGENAIYVIANEVLEGLEQRGATRQRVELHGRVLEVDGIRYFVVT